LPAGALAQLPAPAPLGTACPARGTPVISVELVDPEPRILPQLPARQLRTEAGGHADGAFPHHLGLTTSHVEWRSEITVRAQAGGPGSPVCAVPAELRIRLIHAEHGIRLARELPPGGCLAAEVLAHERRHAEVNRRTLRETANELRGLVRGWAQRAETRAPDINAAAVALQQELAQVMEPTLERLRLAREAGHAAIDTAEEYRRLSRVCPEDQRRLRQSLGRG
jgi:hypothetical protein